MRSLVIVMVLVVGMVFGLWCLWYLARARMRKAYALGDIRAVHGTARLLRIMQALRAINASKNQDLLQRFWHEAELPLLEVLADNTSETREELAELLNQAHAFVRNRELARSLMDLRNRLLDEI